MEREKNLYMFVYRMLLTCIYNGTYKYQSKLPSLPQLCDEYHVGRNTIRSALALLQDGGYVTLQKGVQATVIFDVGDITSNRQYRQALMDVRDMTKDVYDTLTWILPELDVVCFQLCDAKDIADLKELLKHFTADYLHSEAEMMQAMFQIYSFILRFMKNPILMDLFHTLMSYAYQPLTPETQSYANLKRSTNGIRYMIQVVIKLAEKKQEKLAKKMISALCNLHAKSSIYYIDTLCADLKPVQPAHFVWVCNRSHEYLYAEVVMDILNDIASKRYCINDMLPSIAELSKKYDVSDRTSRKALQVLREYRVIETINGLGSRVILGQFHTYEEILENPEIHKHFMAYYHTMQVFRIIMNVVLERVLYQANVDELVDVANQLEKRGVKTMAPLSNYVFKKTNQCLYTIYKQMEKTLDWCTFANMLGDRNPEEMENLRKQLMIALRNGDGASICKRVMHILQLDEQHICHLLRLEAA